LNSLFVRSIPANALRESNITAETNNFITSP
jgi:hypothetical protein